MRPALIFAALALLGCSHSPPIVVVGRWKIDPMSVHGPEIDRLHGQHPEKFDEMIQKERFEFKADSTMLITGTASPKSEHYALEGRDIKIDGDKRSTVTITPDSSRIHITESERAGVTVMDLVRE